MKIFFVQTKLMIAMQWYVHFMSFLHIDMTQVVEILPQMRQGPTYFT